MTFDPGNSPRRSVSDRVLLTAVSAVNSTQFPTARRFSMSHAVWRHTATRILFGRVGLHGR